MMTLVNGKKLSCYSVCRCLELFVSLTVIIMISQARTMDAQRNLQFIERLWRRNSGTNNEDMFFNSLENDFLLNVGFTLDSLSAQHGPFLVHTRDMELQSDVLVFVRRNDKNITLPIRTTTYHNLKAISHLPVTVVTLLTPDLLANNGNLTSSQLAVETRQRLFDFQQRIQTNSIQFNVESFPLPDQVSRQVEIIEAVTALLSSILDQSSNITVDTLMSFANSLSEHLLNNSEDAVRDYLICLNETISSLIVTENITMEEWGDLVVVLSLDPFAQRWSFLAQYYEQLLPCPERLILAPVSSDQQPNCTQTQTATSLSALSDAYLTQSINRIFNNSSSSVHTTLSQAAADFICSEDFPLPFCVSEITLEPGDHIVGFETRIERTYIIVMVFFGGIAVMCGIILGCIMYEDKLMTAERKSQDAKTRFKIDGPTLFTPIGSIEESDSVFSDNSGVVEKQIETTDSVDTSKGESLNDRTSTSELLSNSNES